MTKKDLVQLVLDNPEPACSANALKCNGGYNSGEGQLKWYGYWEFVPSKATNTSFKPTDEFVAEVINNNRRQLRRCYTGEYGHTW